MAAPRIKEELLIVFVYDTGRLMREEDDPVNALVYFYPSWVSDQQKLILCGQIIGTAHCVSSIFSTPRIISLRCGKFVFKHYENYILCVGTDRQAEDWCLQDRADLLYNLISLYHKDLDTIKSNLPRDKHGEGREQDGEDMNEKLTNIFQVYLSLLVHSSIFKHLPILKLPKSGSTSFSESMQLLQCFQGKPGVLGGTIMSRNKILASQLSTKLTKLLAISDPYRLQIPADNIKPSYRLPVGVQLLKIHLPESEIAALNTDTKLIRESIEQVKLRKQNGEHNMSYTGNGDPPSNGNGNRTDYGPSGISRHTSTIFTLHEMVEASSPEETRNESDNTNSTLASQQPEPQSSYSDVNPPEASHLKDSFLTRSLGAVNITDYLAPDTTQVSRHDNLYSSEFDLSEDGGVKHIPVRYYSFGLPKPMSTSCEDSDVASSHRIDKRFYYNTVSDSSFPFFRTNGLPASKSFYNNRMKDLLKILEQQTKQLLKGVTSEETKDKDILLNESTNNGQTPEKSEHSTCCSKSLETPIGESLEQKKPERPQSIGGNLLQSGGSIRKKKHLDLGCDETDKISRPPIDEPTDSGLEDNFEPMTPLRAQLTQSTSELNKWASCLSLGPGGVNGAPKLRPRQKERLVEVALYVVGFQDTAMLLLLDMDSVKTADLVSYLWETSINSLSKLDSLLNSILDPLSSDDASAEYSMLHLHPQWGMIDKSGVWTAGQLTLVSSLFSKLRGLKHLSEIIVKYDYQVIYCYQFSNHQIFYHQNSEASSGLPPPSDLMGSVALKARRRLERDSQLIIL
uniref:Hermansky-Pudlak syndrome 4 protein n=1 Tax=Cacopsylla melanoneura TaxID=428564 RepID=A0A8D8QUX3_9HEMI